jgi:hypothetical protein
MWDINKLMNDQRSSDGPGHFAETVPPLASKTGRG